MMAQASFVVILAALISIVIQAEGAGAASPARNPRQDVRLYRLLKKRLQWSGEPVVRPLDRANQSAATPLGVGFTLIDVQSLTARPSGRTADLQAMGWLKLNWVNPNLKWTPSQFGGIKQVRLPVSMLWTPDIKLYTSTNPESTFDQSALALVVHNGDVLWIPPTKFSSVCHTVSGTQDWTCKWKLGSWTYDGSQISLQAEKAELDTSHLMDPADWDVKNVTAVKKSKLYPCCPETYEHILMTFVLSPNW